MSLWTDARVKELLAEVASLKARVTEIELIRHQPDEESECPITALDQFRAAYFQKFGKFPHHRMKLEKIKDALK